MKKVELYEYKDLDPETQEKVLAKTLENVVSSHLDILQQTLDEDAISETDFYKTLGCSKSYAESTSWFVPSCYYEQHKIKVDEEVKELCNDGLSTHSGKYVTTIS